MRKLKYRLLTSLAVLGALLFIAFGAPPVLSLQSTGTTNEYSFSVSNMPSGTTRVFLEHGDGSYFLGLSGDLNNHKHTYSNGNYTAYTDIIALYDDTNDPKRAMTTINPTGGGTVQPPNIDMNSRQIILKRTCDAVPGDSIVYIITYTQPNTACTSSGTVQFSFDNRVFQYRNHNAYHDEDAFTSASTGYTTTVSLNFYNLSSTEQRTIFFLLETIDDNSLLNHTLDPQPTATITNNFPSTCTGERTLTESDFTTGQTVRSSHDPNYKEVLNNGQPDADGFVYWRIHFQNEGNAPEHTVKVYDWIDPLLDFSTVNVFGSKFTIDQTILDSDRREIRLTMDGIDLRGLGEPGASDESTRGHVDLKAKIDNNLFYRCNAIANSARIYFGCNPPYTTETVLVPLSCQDVGSTDSCIVVLDTIFPPHALAAPNTPVFSSLTEIPVQINTADWQKKWYPTDGLSDPFVLNPLVTTPLCRTYTLVASNEDSCKRVIIRVPVGPAHPLTLNTHWTALSGCPDNPVWQLDASVPHGSPSLCWNDCSMGPSWSKADLSGGQTVYVAVWDTITGCYAEKWVSLPLTCRRPRGCAEAPWAVAAVFVLFIGYLLNRMRNRR